MIDDMGKGGNSKDEISEAKASGLVSFSVQQSRLVMHSHRKQQREAEETSETFGMNVLPFESICALRFQCLQ